MELNMFLANIFKLFIIIFLVYCAVNFFKYLINLNRIAGDRRKNIKRDKSGGAGNGKTIELDKDQYKVE